MAITSFNTGTDGGGEVGAGVDGHAGGVDDGEPGHGGDADELDALLDGATGGPVVLPASRVTGNGLVPSQGVTLGEDVDDADVMR